MRQFLWLSISGVVGLCLVLMGSAQAVPIRDSGSSAIADGTQSVDCFREGLAARTRTTNWPIDTLNLSYRSEGWDSQPGAQESPPETTSFAVVGASFSDQSSSLDCIEFTSRAQPLLSFGLLGELGVGREKGTLGTTAVEKYEAEMSLEELGRSLVRYDGAPGRRVDIRTAGPINVDLGMNLVQSVRNFGVDRELAREVLLLSAQLNELLEPVNSSPFGSRILGRQTQAGSSDLQAADASNRFVPSTVSPDELARIRAENEGSPIATFSEFIFGFLTDPRTILFFGLSIALVLAVFRLLSRWAQS